MRPLVLPTSVSTASRGAACHTAGNRDSRVATGVARRQKSQPRTPASTSVVIRSTTPSRSASSSVSRLRPTATISRAREASRAAFASASSADGTASSLKVPLSSSW